MAFPRSSTDLRKRNFVRARLTEEQEAAIRLAAAAMGMTVSQVLHDACLLWLGEVYRVADRATGRSGGKVEPEARSRVKDRPMEIQGVMTDAQGIAMREAAEALGINLQEAAWEGCLIWLKTAYRVAGEAGGRRN